MAAFTPEVLDLLNLAEAQVDSFFTATCTNAAGRDGNRLLKKQALETIRAAIAKLKAEA